MKRRLSSFGGGKTNKRISVVIPVYNAENSLNELTERLHGTMKQNNFDYEVIFVNDASFDKSLQTLKSLYQTYESTKVINLVQNAGQHAATFCGLCHSNGDYVVVMCDDLQHAPEDIPKLVHKIEEGYDVIYAELMQKKTHFFGSWIMQKLLHIILKIPDSVSISDFIIIRKNVIQRIVNFNPSHVQYNALISLVTNPKKMGNVQIMHYQRKHGRTTYTPIKFGKIFLDLLINHSSIPLQFIATIGFVISFFSVLWAIFLLVRKLLLSEIGLEGWTSLMVTTSFLSGIILLSMGVLGEYVRRMFYEIEKKPAYIIEEILIHE